MSEEQRVIAQTKSHRMHSSGRVESRTVDGMDWQPSWVWDKQDFAALLADAVQRVREELRQEAEQGAMAHCREMRSLAERIEAVEERVSRVGITAGECRDSMGRDHRALADRLAAVEREIEETELRRVKLGSEVFGLQGRLYALEARQQDEDRGIDLLTDRVAGLEQGVAENYSTCTLADKFLHQRIDGVRDTLLENGMRYQQRIEALESRQQDEDPLLRVNRLVTNIVDMEARQQDEAGEEIPEHFDMPGPSRTETRHCLTDEALENLKAEVQASTASAIAERVHGGYWPSFGFISYERRIAMAEDIRREYLSGDRMKEK